MMEEAQATATEESKTKTLRITTPEAWPEAIQLKAKAGLSGSRGKLSFPIRAISYGEYLQIKTLNPLPAVPIVQRGMAKVPDPEDANYIEEHAAANSRRHVATIDACAIKIPGETLEDKITYINQNFHRPGEIMNLYMQIMRLSGLESLPALCETVTEISSIEDWTKSTEAPTAVGFLCGTTNFEFVLHGLTPAKVKAIEAQTEPGPAPLEFKLEPGGGRRGVPERNPENANYKRKVADFEELRMMMLLEAAMFPFPGNGPKSKQDWLWKRPAYQILNLHNFLQNEVLGYRSNVDFS